ncbi:methionyl-tRNA formyltransferase [Patescibacteria group bacterium]|nr:methionyl-tRNA formyltransferase [Patescibacteria group bacterium]
MTPKKQKKIVFFGTPEFAKIILEKLMITEFKPVIVVTAPDKPVGRKQILSASPVKQLAQEHKIKLIQPKLLNNAAGQELIEIAPDLFIIAAYGLILPQEILNIPKFGSLNIHPSLLPKYRGASPIQATILANDQKTGTTIMLMDEKIDHGPILAQQELEIRNSKLETRNKSKIPRLPDALSRQAIGGQAITKITCTELNIELAILGADLLIDTLPKWFEKEIKPLPQDHKKASFTRLIKKIHGKIVWRRSAEQIEQMLRAYQPWPGIYTNLTMKQFNNLTKKLKIIKIDILEIDHNKQPGTVFLTKNKELAVACDKNALILKQIQLQGKKPTSGKSFLNGHQQIINTILS